VIVGIPYALVFRDGFAAVITGAALLRNVEVSWGRDLAALGTH
jgi:hypothetical protein